MTGRLSDHQLQPCLISCQQWDISARLLQFVFISKLSILFQRGIGRNFSRLPSGPLHNRFHRSLCSSQMTGRLRSVSTSSSKRRNAIIKSVCPIFGSVPRPLPPINYQNCPREQSGRLTCPAGFSERETKIAIRAGHPFPVPPRGGPGPIIIEPSAGLSRPVRPMRKRQFPRNRRGFRNEIGSRGFEFKMLSLWCFMVELVFSQSRRPGFVLQIVDSRNNLCGLQPSLALRLATWL